MAGGILADVWGRTTEQRRTEMGGRPGDVVGRENHQ